MKRQPYTTSSASCKLDRCVRGFLLILSIFVLTTCPVDSSQEVVARDLDAGEVIALIQEADGTAIDSRDTYNRPSSENLAILRELFDFSSSLDILAIEIGLPSIHEHNYVDENSINRYLASVGLEPDKLKRFPGKITIPQMYYAVVPRQDRKVLAGVPRAAGLHLMSPVHCGLSANSTAGTMLTITLLFLFGSLSLQSPSEPRFRFLIQRE